MSKEMKKQREREKTLNLCQRSESQDHGIVNDQQKKTKDNDINDDNDNDDVWIKRARRKREDVRVSHSVQWCMSIFDETNFPTFIELSEM